MLWVKILNLAIDIDDTITAIPEFFRILTNNHGFKKVIIVSSRTNNDEARKATEEELSEYGVIYDKLILIDSMEKAAEICPHKELSWYDKYLWQKVNVCLQENVDVVFEDDPKVVDLFSRFAGKVKVMFLK